MDGLTTGRIVHYVLTEKDAENIWLARIESRERVGNVPAVGDHVPAMVVHVNDQEAGTVNLQCFLDGNDSRWKVDVPFDYVTGTIPGTWHWIEKA